jgi:uncharacterized protein (DUF952 family)
MRSIYHLVPRTTWDAAPPGPYRAASLDSEGFVHCCNRDQVEHVANLFYASGSDLLLLEIDATHLGDLLRDEDAGTGELFPHVYGPIDRSVILAVRSLTRDPAGRWRLQDSPP